MNFTPRQEEIIKIVRDSGHITGDGIAKELKVPRATLRPDLTLLTMLEILGAKPKYGYFFKGHKNYFVFAEFIKTYPVEDIMSMPVILEDTTSVYDAIVTLFLENVGAIYVTREGVLVGVISRKDLLRAAIGQVNLNDTPINVVMTRMPNVKRVYRDTSIHECSKLLVESQVDGVPVVEAIDGDERNLKVVGRITKTNITNLFVRLGNEYDYKDLT